MISKKEIRDFQELVWKHFKKYGRHDLPWRKTKDPYKILVSEVMLQQTQVARVIPKYHAFLKKFPTVQKLADASLRDVLYEWQGLGYNRRAKALKRAAEIAVQKYDGRIPVNLSELISLPGIGSYTAGAVLAFAFNKPVPCIETNIRTAYLHHFFSHQTVVSDKELAKVVAQTLDTKKPREWFWALMDYGAHLKASGIRLNAKKAGYKQQSKFKGSDREIRGAIIRAFTQQKDVGYTPASLAKNTQHEQTRIAQQLEQLKKEGLVEKKGRVWKIAR